MKKIMPIMICIVASLLFAMPCMADETFGSSPNELVIKTSGNVELAYVVSTNHDHFAINGLNTQGTIEYGVSSYDNLVYYKEFGTATAPSTVSAPSTTTNSFGTGWTPMGS